jgi:hypothetical protein
VAAVRALMVVSLVALAMLPSVAAAEEYSAALCTGYAAQYDAAPSQDNIGKLMSAASCHEKGGRLGDALAGWKRALRETTNPETRGIAQGSVTRLEKAAATIEVTLRPGASAVTVTIDGAPASLGEPVSVNAGEHDLATSDGASMKHTSVDGERLEVLVPFEAVAPKENGGGGVGGTAGPEADRGSRGMVYGGVASLSIGGLGAIGFVVTGALSLSKDAELDEHCNEDRTDCMKLGDVGAAQDIADAGQALNIANIVTLVVGVVGVGVGVPLVIVGASRSRRATTLVAPPLPWATPTAGGVVWGGAF